MKKPDIAALRGVLGSFLLAWFFAWLWFSCTMAAYSWGYNGKLTLLLCFLIGPGACLGYWLFRGPRKRRFACYTTYLCTVLAIPPGFLTAALLDYLPVFGSLKKAWAVLWSALSERSGTALAIWISVGFLALVWTRLCQRPLLKYSDASWFGDPRRMAAEYAGGSFYNYRPAGMPPLTRPLPLRFKVGSVLEVNGSVICTTPSLRNARTFSVTDVAGVVLGPGTGSNVLYDFQGRSLAKFAWSMENADLFAVYLQEEGVSLVPLAQYKPPPEAGESIRKRI